MKRLLILPLFVFAGCSALESLPWAGGVFEGLHESYTRACDAGPLLAGSVSRAYIEIGCESHTDALPHEHGEE